MTVDVEYTVTGVGKFPHQVIVRRHPSRIAALFGAKPSERTFVSDYVCSQGTAVWYEIPGFTRLSATCSLDAVIERHIREDLFVGAPP